MAITFAKGRRIMSIGGGSPPIPANKKLSFVVNFASPPSQATITKPKQKYNKLGFYTPQWDDGSFGAPTMMDYFNNNLFYTDGCGHSIPYSGDLAVNCGFGIPSDPGYNPAYIQPPLMQTMLNNNWALDNHGYYHGSNGNANPDTDLGDLDALMLLRVGYLPRTMVVPTNYPGYTHAAFIRDYVATTSQGDVASDEFINKVTNAILPPLALPPFMYMTRDFNDEWQDPQDPYAQTQVQNLLNGQREFYIMGTHSDFNTPEKLAGFKAWMQYVHDTTNDKVVVASLQEMVEYREMCMQPITTTLTGSQLLVEINIENLPAKNRWRDLSFIVNANTAITGITNGDFTSSTFNSTTKLVNVFKQNKTWQI